MEIQHPILGKRHGREFAIHTHRMEDVSHFLRYFSQISAFTTANIVLILHVKLVCHLHLKNTPELL